MACADQSACQSNFGRSHTLCSHGCCGCEIETKHFTSPSLDVHLDPEERTITKNMLAAHLIPGWCKGCNSLILDHKPTKEEKREEKLLAKAEKRPARTLREVTVPGDQTPSVPAGMKGAGVSWLSLHLGQKYGCGPIFTVEPSKWIVCVLHLNLRLVGAMLKYGIFANIIATESPTGKDEGSLAHKIWLLMREHNVTIQKVHPIKNEFGSFYRSITKHSFKLVKIVRQF